eukprot:COSAG06_NODE_17809_length_920_cov_1.149817_1_plen_189_part_00
MASQKRCVALPPAGARGRGLRCQGIPGTRRSGRAVRAKTAIILSCECFPCVCPQPVLANDQKWISKTRKRSFLLTSILRRELWWVFISSDPTPPPPAIIIGIIMPPPPPPPPPSDAFGMVTPTAEPYASADESRKALASATEPRRDAGCIATAMQRMESVRPCEKRLSCLSFSCLCPEPVLVKNITFT